ncbi:MAG TPA: LarC family nickel insertion protein, partial [Kofleriaceae bacterium]|nr:LarC family nickel insertion protein [Kofleriaceae bacterium]
MKLRGLHLHVDCASGAAGDMMLGAMIDLGVPTDVIGAALDAIGAGRQRLRIERVVKRGIASVDLKVDTSGSLGLSHAHDIGVDSGSPRHANTRPRIHVHSHGTVTHTHDHPRDHVHAPHAHDHRDDHAHHHYADIRGRIADAPLTEGCKRRALDIFDRIARAEAKLHGSTFESVSFHEVGAIDSIVDVVGTAAALDYLSPASVTCTSVAMGHGTITCAHGVLPVPAPAALEVLREAGGVMADGGVARELCTPTGAAILAHAVTSWSGPPTGKPIATGWGAGDAELLDRANVLRLVALELSVPTANAVYQIEANLDDMSPELCAPAAD